MAATPTYTDTQRITFLELWVQSMARERGTHGDWILVRNDGTGSEHRGTRFLEVLDSAIAAAGWEPEARL